jgi:PPP family 3-phenylpropionic acid transporter
LFYAAFFLGTGVQLPFWPVWLAGRGLGAAEIGALMALTQWMRVAASPLLGIAADRVRDRRRFMLALAAFGLVGYGLCVPAHGFAPLIVPALAIAIASSTQLSLADATALSEAARGRLDYGRVRLWGTIAFIAATAIVGPVLAGRPSDLVLYLLLGTAGLVAAASAAMPPQPAPVRRDARGGWRALAAPRNLVFVAAATLIGSSHAVYYSFGTLYWQHLGFGDGTIAWLWAEGAVAEVVLFRVGGRLVRRVGSLPLLAIGGLGGCVRWVLTASATSLPALVLVQPLHALSFAAAHLAAMHYIAGAVPDSHAGKAQTFYSAIVGGLGLGLASAAAGVLYGSWGGAAYLAMAAMAGAGAALAWSASAQRQVL